MGFDFFYGAHYSNDMKPYRIYRNRKVKIEAPADQEKLTRHFTKEALDFISRNKDDPFFLYYAQPFPHIPLHASDDFKKSSRAGLYGDVVQEIDWSIGKILDKLDDEGLTENTLVIFTSDNGPWYQGSPGYHRGRKNQNYEGGQRVPFVASWPSKIPEGTKTRVPAMNIDLLPTVLEIIDVPLPSDRIIDGIAIDDVLFGNEIAENKNRPLYYFWNSKLQAVRQKNWKFHAKHRSDNSSYWYSRIGPFLFNLETDENESYNQIMHYPEVRSILEARIIGMRKRIKSNLRGWKS